MLCRSRWRANVEAGKVSLKAPLLKGYYKGPNGIPYSRVLRF